MTQRDVTWALVDVISYDHLWPPRDNEDAVFGFTHSREVNGICADTLPPHVVTPVTKPELERALADYIGRRGIGAEDEAAIRRWMANLPDNIAIIEREPFPFG
ncbi:hypothetical protein GBAR_LOCUS2336 [Geodia barretti]|jgi:hypothetical protein|uniref:Uncharacterized protein n=1 Tax=Geodia barretti TaxID=519541 RepID=A0AA35W4P7_GEOBA|nr:hypothetical protein GBAR_LOCUS2336 [Geodia barretti]